MKIVQRSVGLFFVFLSCISSIFSVTSIEMRLNKAYMEIGFSREDARTFCGNLNGLCKKLLGFEYVKYRGVSAESLCLIMRAGMLINLSDNGIACIKQEAEQFARSATTRYFSCLNGNRLSCKNTRLLRAEAKRFVFSWITLRLKRYEKLSFYHAYTMQHDGPTVTLEASSDSGDFVADVVTLDEVIEELRDLGLTVQ